MERPLKPRHLPRYLEIGKLLLKHRDRFAASGDEVGGEATEDDASALVAELEAMGPTFVKLGQLLSTRADLLPPVYLSALARLQDDVQPLEDGVAAAVVQDELGVRLSKAFAEFDERPLASASLGEVHRATLRDGRRVAVKVQRPGVEESVANDMAVIEELAAFVERHSEVARRLRFRAMISEFGTALAGELDYRFEAENLRRLGDELSSYPRIVVPQPIADYTTSRVLTMELVDGRNVASIGPIGRMELDGAPLIGDLFRAYLDQVLIHGFFHADPHPGNVLLTDDNRLALIDLGMVARISPDMRHSLLRLVLGLSEQRGEEVADTLERIGDPLVDFDRSAFRRQVGQMVLRADRTTAGSLEAGSLLGELSRVAGESGLQPPPELAMLAKALLNLDEIARRLDPDFDPNAVIRDHAAELMQRHMRQEVSPRRLLAATLDAKEFAERLPNRLNKVLEAVAEGEFRLNVKGFDEPALMRGIQKLANRVGIGIVVAACVLAAAIFSNSHAAKTIGGYPVLTYIFLFLALVGGVWLVAGIVRNDLPQRVRRR